MAKALLTKRAIAGAMKDLMRDLPFESITVDAITERCGLSHKTFYYHFRDKYDVVNWIFRNEIMGEILKVTTPDSWLDGSVALCRHIQENRVFYRNALKVTGQNSFTEYLYELTNAQVERLVAALCGGKQGLGDPEFRFLVDFYYHAFVGILKRWVNEEEPCAVEAIVERWSCVVDHGLEKFVGRYASRGQELLGHVEKP
jgi:probable dihydroxyacetone kinase regulator